MSEGLGRSDAIRDRPYDRDQLDLMIMTAVRKANRDALRRPDQCNARLQESAERLGIGDRGAKVDTAIRFRLRDVKETGRAHVRTTVTNGHLGVRHLLEI